MDHVCVNNLDSELLVHCANVHTCMFIAYHYLFQAIQNRAEWCQQLKPAAAAGSADQRQRTLHVLGATFQRHQICTGATKRLVFFLFGEIVQLFIFHILK